MTLDKLTIATTNTSAMVTFYNAVFNAGLRAIPETPFFAGQIGGIALMFCPNEITQIKAEKNRIQMRFTVDDIDAIIASAQVNGGDTYGDRHADEAVIAWGISDPDGNSIELRQLKNTV